ncbi:MAG: hypothetical protein L7S53_10125 [Luminiphilus sp.]|nr:hypothetical protein [Luminiphilus sp.]
MNSEQIESRFGSYRVKVLLQDANSRLASLCSEHDGKDICRTLAVTRFVTPVPGNLVDADKLIREGHSIGSTLKQAGMTISRNVVAEGTALCGEGFAELAGGQVGIDELLQIRVYKLLAGPHDTAMVPYAIIAEAHHPEHIPPLTGMAPVSELTTVALDEDATLAMAILLSALKYANA